MDFDAAARASGYRVYTTDFDQVRDIRDVFPEEEVARCRDAVEAYSLPYDDVLPGFPGRKTDAPELDAAVAELAHTVTHAVNETGIEPADTVLAFLLDNSGSIRDLRPVMARAMARVCAVLDSVGFDTPVVGHTTVEWKGGQSRKRWLSEGRPLLPGRLNDLLITVYKQPGEPTVDGDLRLYGLVAGKGAFKENIDGEALAWVAGRVNELEARHKAIVFVSDGDFPVDDSTMSQNPDSLLKDHKAAVVREIESSDIDLVNVVATTRADMKADPARSTFGGTLRDASEFVRAVTHAVDRAVRLAASQAYEAGLGEPGPRP